MDGVRHQGTVRTQLRSHHSKPFGVGLRAVDLVVELVAASDTLGSGGRIIFGLFCRLGSFVCFRSLLRLVAFGYLLAVLIEVDVLCLAADVVDRLFDRRFFLAYRTVLGRIRCALDTQQKDLFFLGLVGRVGRRRCAFACVEGEAILFVECAEPCENDNRYGYNCCYLETLDDHVILPSMEKLYVHNCTHSLILESDEVVPDPSPEPAALWSSVVLVVLII